MKLHKYLYLILLVLHNTIALDILAIYPYQGKSHFLVFRVFLRELANRGHNVTVISHFPEAEPPKNYHDISLANTVEEIEDTVVAVQASYLTVISIANYLTLTGKENCEVMLEKQEVRDLIDNKRKFDVVLVEQFNSDCALGIAYKLKAPVVGTTSHVLMPYHFDRYGIPNNPAFVSFHFLGGGTKPSLFQRLERTVFDFYFRAMYYCMSQRSNQNTLAKYYDDIPPLEELARDIKFLLLYHNFILTGSKLLPANVIEVGGYHVAKAKPLNGDLKKFVDSAKDGIIYISFGSVVRSSSLPAEKVTIILEALKEFPQKVIWKWNDKSMSIDKNKFYIEKWLPQVDILGDPKTVAFISHAGMGGTTESLHFGVPMIAMPVLGDQLSNAASIDESGLGVLLEHKDLTKETLVAALRKVLDPQFLNQVKGLSKAWHDRPLTPLDTAVFWTEFAARHSNLTYRSPAADVPFYQYRNLDIFVVFLASFLVTFYLVKILCCKGKENQVVGRKIKSNSKKLN